MLCLVCLTVTHVGAVKATAQDEPGKRRNIIVFVIDELRYDEIGPGRQSFLRTPNIDALADGGTSFRNYYAVAPICSPNRASMLTGQYPPIHGVVDNTDRTVLSKQLRTFATELSAAGYHTAHVGKWHMGNDPTPRPGFDFWVALPGQGRIENPEIWENGELHTVHGYVTDILTDRAIAFLEQPREAPFLLYFAHKAIHPDARQRADSSVDLDYGIRYIPAPRHDGIYAKEPVNRPPSVRELEADLAGKPVVRRALQRKRSKETVTKWGQLLDIDSRDDTIRKRAEMLLAIDDSVGRVIDVLRRQKQLQNTVIIFTSDNAGFLGEHGLTIERRLPYEEVIHLPLIVYYPGIDRPKRVLNELVLSVDIAPTILDIAGDRPDYMIQGDSFLPLLTSSAKEWRNSFVIEHRPDERPFSWLSDLQYVAVRRHNLKLIRWLRYPKDDELYDLANDPYEQQNLYHDPAYTHWIPELNSELASLLLRSRGL